MYSLSGFEFEWVSRVVQRLNPSVPGNPGVHLAMQPAMGVPVPSTHCCAPPTSRKLAASVRHVRDRKMNIFFMSSTSEILLHICQKTEFCAETVINIERCFGINKKLAVPLFRRLCRLVLCQLLPGPRFAASYSAARRGRLRGNAVAQPIQPFIYYNYYYSSS